MSPNAKANLRGALLALCAFAIFALHDVAVKVLGARYAPFQIIFFSVLMGFPLATIMLMRDATAGHLRPVHPWWTALRTLAAVTTGFCAFYAFSVLPMAQTYAIIFAAPLLITVLSIPVLGERVGAHRWVAVLVGLAGVFTVLRPGTESLQLGHLAALGAAIGSATTSVVVRKIGKDERSAVLMLYPMVANFLVMAAILPFVYVPMPLVDLGLAGVIASFGFAASLLIILAYRHSDAAIVAPMQYSQIIWAAVFGAAFFDERPDTMTWIGAGIIITSGLYIVARESLSGRSDNTPVLSTRSRPETGTIPRISALLRLRTERSAHRQALAKRPENG
ncbi:DMT family transporter [Profundibacterium mesophilum]|uniref:Transporter RhaT family DMT superfamily protein n=1 Tax=Profundibacterium mesophilum KAUST100406-0324 TaxID=1037889 RepID=A0A921TDC1_9RHOB|nr:DMT family transporter [Profundibacterium mesophilum]KAF0676002.1 putative transporter RhaT family DMT superfamily protein [Profundibacterium mesophilum KAUST100406-0324]